MGLFDWLRGRAKPEAKEAEASTPPEPEIAPGCPVSEWEEVPAYIPVDPSEHMPAVVIASAIAAGERAQSELTVKNVLVANPEHQCVTAISAALVAGAMEKSEFVVRKVYKQKPLEESHAA